MDNAQLLGSLTARNGFKNEHDIVARFNDWSNELNAQKWLQIMGYEINKIELVEARVISRHKADVNVQIKVKLKHVADVENIQVKLVSNPKGFNQIDKRPVDAYNEVLNWNMPSNIVSILKRFTGELPPSTPNPRDRRRMFIDEFPIEEQNELIDFLQKNKALIVNDILRGRGEFTAEWVLVAQKVEFNARWVLKKIVDVINHYDGDVKLSPRGSINIGRILLQRKGGTPDPTSLQFKINPAELFDI